MEWQHKTIQLRDFVDKTDKTKKISFIISLQDSGETFPIINGT